MNDDSGAAVSPETADPPASTAPLRRARAAAARLNDRRRARKRRRSTTRRRIERSLLGVVLVILVVIGGSGAYVIYRVAHVGRVEVHNLAPQANGSPDDILLVGSTSRCAVTAQKHFENFVKQCQDAVNGVNSDVVMVLRLVPGEPPRVLSIPRDTFVPNARAGGLSNKIDAALANGPSQLVAAVEEDFGIPINHYVVLNFQTFANIVTALGGITMYFPTTLYDAQSGLNISHSGCLHISGLEALALVRARHVQYHYDKKRNKWLGYDGTGDLGRIVRVHEFLRVLASEVASRGLGNVITDQALLDAVVPNLTLDQTFSTRDLLHILLAYHHSIGAAVQYTLPVIVDATTYEYKGFNYGDVVFPAEPEDAETVATFLGAKGVPGVVPSSVTISVADGTGSHSATVKVARDLAAMGFKTTVAGSFAPVGPIAETVVRYASSKSLLAAERVAAAFHGTAVLAKGPTVGGSEVTVITGTNAVADATVVTVPVKASTAAVTTGTLAAQLLSVMLTAASVPNNNGSLDPPTYASTALPAFDPRACATR